LRDDFYIIKVGGENYIMKYEKEKSKVGNSEVVKTQNKLKN